MEKGSHGVQVSLLNLVGSVTSSSLLRKLAEKGILWRNDMKFPPSCMEEVMNYVQLTSAESEFLARGKMEEKEDKQGRKRINIYILVYVNNASNTISFKNGGK